MKKVFTSIVPVLMAITLLFPACSEEEVIIPITGVLLSTGASITMTVGETIPISATLQPINATRKEITWNNSNPEVASITGDVLTAHKAGETTITALVGDKSFSCTITVIEAFIAVTNITGVPTSATAGTPLTLTGTVVPANATHKTITWDVVEAGTTEATLDGNTLNTTAEGTVILQATITNGATSTTPYTQEFTISVTLNATFVAVTNIANLPSTTTAGALLILSGTVEPTNATHKTITWSVVDEGTTGAVIISNVLSTTAAGTATLRATIANGATETTPYTKDFTITVNAAFVAVTDIVDLPSTTIIGTLLLLTGTVEPADATNQTISWSVVDAGTTGATITSDILYAATAGTVIVQATIANGLSATTPYTKEFPIEVSPIFVPVSLISEVPTTAVAGIPLTLTGTVEPATATHKTISWSLVDAGTTEATLNGSTLNNIKASGTIIVIATITNGKAADTDYEQAFAITVIYFYGNGTMASPYLIGSAADLNRLSELINTGNPTYSASSIYYRVQDDFTMPTVPTGVSNHTPIGTESNPFRGTFDGNNQIISNLTISNLSVNPTSSYTGLFGYVNGGKISNLGLANANISGGTHDNTGGVAGYITGNGATITGCYVTGKVIGTSNVGGITGSALSNANITNCYTTCSVSGSDLYVGSIVGNNSNSVVERCYATGNISGPAHCGGIVGINSGTGAVRYNVALHQSISKTSGDSGLFGRVAGSNSSGGTLLNNYAYKGMMVLGVTTPDNIAGIDGEGVVYTDVSTADTWTTWGFVSPPWTVQNSRLPGLFGKTVDIPGYIY